MSQRLLFAISLATLFWCDAACIAQTVFRPLGDLDGLSFFSAAYDVSGDGSTVVGDSHGVNGYEAFRWTLAFQGMVGLGDLPGGAFQSGAAGVSYDGDVIVGTSIVGDPFVYEGFRWRSGFGLIHGIGDLPSGDFTSFANAVSDDGETIVGESTVDSGFEVFRWNSDGFGSGLIEGLGFDGTATDVSADGNTIVGGPIEAYRWTEATGRVVLPDSPSGHSPSEATAVSPDGNTIVGWGNTPPFNIEAFRWTAADGTIGLGILPGDTESMAEDVSADGSIVVGASAWFGDERAFIWDEVNGIQSLQDVITNEYGVHLTGWTLNKATGISDDGTVLVGYGVNPAGNTEAWMATLGGTTIPGDFDGDVDVDGNDFLIWQQNFPSGNGADADGDGDSDGDDFLIWQQNFGSGGGEFTSEVPEPHAIGLLLTGGLVLMGWTWQARKLVSIRS